MLYIETKTITWCARTKMVIYIYIYI